MNVKKHLIRWTLLLLAGFSCVLNAQTLTILTEVSPPGQTKAADGKFGGFAVEVVREIQRRVGNTDYIQEVPWARGHITLQNKPNTILFSVARAAERNPLFQWVGPIGDG